MHACNLSISPSSTVNFGRSDDLSLTNTPQSSFSSTLGDSTSRNLLSLPVELLLDVLSYVPWSDYYAVSQTSTLLRRLCNLPNSLSSSRYGYFNVSDQSQNQIAPAKVHRIFESAIYRAGTPCFSPDVSGTELSEKPIEIRISDSRFKLNSFSCPKYDKIITSWIYISPLNIPAKMTAEDSPIWTYAHTGGYYVNNIIVGSGRSPDSQHLGDCDSGLHSASSFSPTDVEVQEQTTYITVWDIFEAFDRDHPALRSREGGKVKILGFRHVFHLGAGSRGGIHFEVRWSQIPHSDR